MFLRWSRRDLRRHWVAVVAIALVMAIGTGVFAGLGSTATWRRQSNDESFAATGIHDLRAELSPGTFVAEGVLLDVVRGLPEAGQVEAAMERLVVDNQIDASTEDETILVRARVVGMDFDDGQVVDEVWVRDGALPSVGASPPTAVLEVKFADVHDLAAPGTFQLAGGRTVAYEALGTGPEDFYVSGPEGTGAFAQGDFAIVYLPLADAQEVVDRPGAVNDVVFTLTEGADVAAIAASLETAIDALDGVSATVTDADDVEAFRLLYEDIDSDQQVWTMLSALILLAAALAAFNLVTRIVESQRREIGIGMALGVSRRRLAIRPLLVGLEIGLIGTAAGVGVGLIVGWAMKRLMETFIPLPVWQTSFQFDVYAQAALLGLLVPIAAAALPVWRAVRVEPIEAIRTGHLSARGSRWTDWTNRLRLPGSTFTHMPIRNVLRTPRRAVLTALGVGAAITALVAVLGMLDSLTQSIDRGGEEVTKGDPDRVLVQLDTFHAVDGELVEAIAAEPAVGVVDVGLALPISAVTKGDEDDLEMLLEFVAIDTAAWTPTIVDGDDGRGGGLILAEKAATDLGVQPGDELEIIHPARAPDGGFALAESTLTVAGIHPNPIRRFAYADLSVAAAFGFGGEVNLLNVSPAAGFDRGELQQAVFPMTGVTSTQPVARLSEIFDEALEQFVGFLFVAAGAVLVLAMLIAFNSSRITVEERRREHATMRAFGLPVRTVMGVVIKESVIVGVAATGIGVASGVLILGWMLDNLADQSLPDFGISVYVAPQTLAIALVVGVVAVAVAPLFLIRSVRRMNLPDTLRVME